MTGYMHSFQSLATLDGAGVRCAVFMQGCPLRCAYCHNPDTWISGKGQAIDAETLVKKIARYKTYFGAEGGVTFSGGEPLCQSGFLRECVPLLKGENINYAIDTSGCVELSESVRFVVDNAQMVILDLKFAENSDYLAYTGIDMKKTLSMLDYLEKIKKRTWIRTVIVPGINDSEERLEKYLEIIRRYTCVEKYELAAFHTMGFFKYDELGIANPFAGKSALDSDVRDRLQAYADKKLNK